MALWVIKGGPSAERDDRMVDRSLIGIGWSEVGDLAAYPDREALKSAYRGRHPGASAGHVNAQVGQMWAFIHGIEIGDTVALPLRGRREIAIGEVTGAYRWTDAHGSDLRHVRDVRWIITDAPRSAFESDLLFSMGSGKTLYPVTRNDAERRVRATVGAAGDWTPGLH